MDEFSSDFTCKKTALSVPFVLDNLKLKTYLDHRKIFHKPE